jgi:hypothetical protein
MAISDEGMATMKNMSSMANRNFYYFYFTGGEVRVIRVAENT